MTRCDFSMDATGQIKARVAPEPRESSRTDTIIKYLRKRGCWWLKKHGSRWGRAGIPDLIVCYRGRFVGFEVKRPDNTPTALQARELAGIKKAGGTAVEVWTIEQVAWVLDTIDAEMR